MGGKKKEKPSLTHQCKQLLVEVTAEREYTAYLCPVFHAAGEMWTGKEKAMRFQVAPNSPKTLVSTGWLKEAILPNTDQREACFSLYSSCRAGERAQDSGRSALRRHTSQF